MWVEENCIDMWNNDENKRHGSQTPNNRKMGSELEECTFLPVNKLML